MKPERTSLISWYNREFPDRELDFHLKKSVPLTPYIVEQMIRDDLERSRKERMITEIAELLEIRRKRYDMLGVRS